MKAKELLRLVLLAIVATTTVIAWKGYQSRQTALLKEANMRTRYIIAAQKAGMGMVEVSPNTNEIVSCDEVAEKILGFNEGELAGHKLSEIMPAGLAAIHQNMMKAAMERIRNNPGNEPRVVIVPCIAINKQGKQIKVVTRALIDPDQDTMFATINLASGVHYIPDTSHQEVTDQRTPYSIKVTPPMLLDTSKP